MAIEFHCPHCGHKIRAAAEHAGKHGKCPTCKNPVYVPTPSEELEPLRLAPVDDADRRAREKADEEARLLAQRMREERGEIPPEAPRAPVPDDLGDARLQPDMESLVTHYVLCMAEGKLDEAEALAKDIRADLPRAQEYIQRLVSDDLPPTRLSHVPRGVLLKFLKQLQKG